MKKTVKGYILGFLSAVILVGGVAYAANTTTLYDVMNSGIKIVVDGQKLNPTDANGEPVEPMIYNGTTYLPVRAVANAFGKAVYWDGPNYTVYLGDMDGALEYPTVELEDMVSIDDQPVLTDELTDNYGNRYSRAVTNKNIGHTLEYLLNMKYSKLKGVIYVPEGEDNTREAYLTVEADGNTIYTSPTVTKASKPIPFDIDVTGYNDVKIIFNGVIMCLGDAGFYQ